MKLLENLGLAEKEQKIIVNVIKFSLLATVVIVFGSWVIQYAMIQSKVKKRSIAESDPTIVYEKTSKELLPIDIEAHTFAEKYYLKTDQPAKAIEHLLRILPLQKPNSTVFLDLATAYLSSMQYEKAYVCFVKLNDAVGKDTSRMSQQIRSRLGLTLFYCGKVKESMTLLDDCISNTPSDAEALCYRGEVEAAISSDTIKPEEYFNKAIAVDSIYVEALYQLARFSMNHHDYAKARLTLLRILDIEPLHVKTHSRLGMAYYYLDQPELARKSYLTALALNPLDYNTHYNLGELYYSKFGDEKHALDEFKLAVEGSPDHAEANYKIGLICLNNNMAKEAVSCFDISLKVNPKNVRILLQRGVAFEKLSMKDEALENYKTILEFDPLNMIALQKVKLLTENK